MYELKTKVNDASVQAYIDAITDPARRSDCERLVDLMSAATKSEPKMWGTSIVGFGQYHYRYASGQEGDWMLTAFSNRVQSLTLYVMAGFEGHGDLMARLGKYKNGKSCIYVKSLGDIDLKVLKTLIAESIKFLKAKEKETRAQAGSRPPKKAAGKAEAKKVAPKKSATKKASVQKKSARSKPT